MMIARDKKRWEWSTALGTLALAALLGVGCSTARQSPEEPQIASTAFRGSRAPASTTNVLRKLMVEATEDGSAWLVKLLGKDPQAEKLAVGIRSALSTLKPSEIREDQKLLSILSKDVLDVSEGDARYLLEFAKVRAANLADCAECLIRRKEFLGYRKIIRERMLGVAGDNVQSRRHVLNFLKRVEVLLDKDVADPKRVSDFLAAVNAERFKGAEVATMLDTVQAMLLSVGKDIDPKAAAEIINGWPDASLKGLRKFYSEVVLAQASEGRAGSRSRRRTSSSERQ